MVTETELERSRRAKLCKAIKAINTPDGFYYAEVAEVAKGRATVFVKREAISEFYDTLANAGIYPLIIESGAVYTLRVFLSADDSPLFEEVSL